ncbi:Thioredoxin-like fold protein [Niveomyces insectorum RCEF 264]|uniref:Thioredoxin-like fold protein n=1 Tax=Niveomyces insectorum RCEF 264 TaxID=1081102 RepID=A0A167MPG8_9HYPO|nr:Thioredoxin-like fold protein [Niveomyces insectorum RCEF 264]
MAAIAELTSLEDYRAELSKPGRMVIDFYSTQCPPCKVIAPFYEKIAAKPANQDVRFFKINGLEEPGYTIQQAAGVVWWPTFVVYDNGEETFRRKVPNPPELVPVNELESYLEGKQQSADVDSK